MWDIKAKFQVGTGEFLYSGATQVTAGYYWLCSFLAVAGHVAYSIGETTLLVVDNPSQMVCYT